MNILSKYFFVVITLSTTACMPDHLKELDGKKARAVFSKNSSKAIVLRNDSGLEFFADSEKLDVKFEINRISPSRLYVSDQGQTAVFEIPKSVLNKNESVFSIPAHISKQPVDLRVKESSVILREWIRYEHSTTPISTVSCMNNICTQTITGFTDDYSRVRSGIVQYNLFIDVYGIGASASGFPESKKQGSLKMAIFSRQETLSSQNISSSEYRENVAR